jgi:type IV pilus assembly protein PilA
MPRAKKRSVTSVRRLPGAAGRGFTLVELLITVAMIGVLSALGLVGYRKYVHSSQSSEAKAIIQMIRGGEEAFKAENLVYLHCSTGGLTDYYPYDPTTGTPDQRFNWVRPNDAKYNTLPTPCPQGMCGGWAALNIAPDAPVRFGYAVIAGVGGQLTAPTALSTAPTMPTLAGGVPWYVIQAINKHNPSSSTWAVFASASTSGEILFENEQE